MKERVQGTEAFSVNYISLFTAFTNFKYFISIDQYLQSSLVIEEILNPEFLCRMCEGNQGLNFATFNKLDLETEKKRERHLI